MMLNPVCAGRPPAPRTAAGEDATRSVGEHRGSETPSDSDGARFLGVLSLFQGPVRDPTRRAA